MLRKINHIHLAPLHSAVNTTNSTVKILKAYPYTVTQAKLILKSVGKMGE